MKRIALALFLLFGLSGGALAQCEGIFPAGSFCGNPTAAGALADQATPTQMFDRAFCGTANSALARIAGSWVCLASANSGVWITSAAGVPSISSTLPNAVQDNITRLGTIANIGAALGATFGGTGQSSYAVGDLLFAPTTTTIGKLADVATGNAVISGGVGTAPAYGKIGLTTHISGTLGLGNGGTAQTTAPLARASSGLNIDAITTHGDSIYTILSTDRVVATSAAFTASRTWTLPAANSVNAGQLLVVADLAGGVTGTNTLVITRAGADTINGGTSVTISAANNAFYLISDGTSKWTAQAQSAAPGTGTVTSVATGAGLSGGTITTTGTLVNTGAGNIVLQTFCASGCTTTIANGSTGTYTATAGLIKAELFCLAGAGGGGGSAAAPLNTVSTASGGGSGSWAKTVATAATIGVSQTVTMSTPGTGGAAGANNGNASTDASIGAIVVGKGGSGGTGAAPSAQTPGAGGVAGTGDIKAAGETGSAGTQNWAGSFNQFFAAGNGANSIMGGGGAGGAGLNTGAGGSNGTGFGAGGGGAGSSNGTGGAGGNGSSSYCYALELIKP